GGTPLPAGWQVTSLPMRARGYGGLMTISEKDIKLLWGRAAGRCSRPGCGKDLTSLLNSGQSYVIGEMAHVIGRKPGAARAGTTGGPDTYDNLILLCPDDHTHIDKAPEDAFPESTIKDWKQQHEARIREVGATITFQTFDELSDAVYLLLSENRLLFDALGPKSEAAQVDPSSNLYQLWELRRLDKIVPNNRKIVNMIDANVGLLTRQALMAFNRFKLHAAAYERHVYTPLDRYPLFPPEFAKEFGCHE
ncbi:MAG: HNH endonuclease signature motif containing protein, partial [Minicystis sp.]